MGQHRLPRPSKDSWWGYDELHIEDPDGNDSIVTAPDDAPSPTGRPLSVTVVGWLFVAAGSVGLVYHATELRAPGPFDSEVIWVLLVRLAAIVGGAFVLRGARWASWLLVAWMAYHVVLSALHSWSEAAVHAVLLVGVAYLLLRPEASAYFRRPSRVTGRSSDA